MADHAHQPIIPSVDDVVAAMATLPTREARLVEAWVRRANARLEVLEHHVAVALEAAQTALDRTKGDEPNGAS